MYTRDAFDRQRAARKEIERREGRLLAMFSVGLGFAQLIFIRWAESNLERDRWIGIAGAAFLAYMAGVAFLVWRMQRKINATAVACPQCHRALRGTSERIAAATAKCDSCGGQVIQ